ncbi:MAG TPA: hypothetical protein VMB79_04055 [Jatrophihabitans sp.]|nr:hypothetical protein [Jatrophihabitans sp.]
MSARRRAGAPTDSHLFPTRPYDLVKEFSIALLAMTLLTLLLAAVFSSPDDKAITMQQWAQADPNDVVATAAGELAGTTTSASYGAPYNHASSGQQLGPLSLQRWAGVRIPVDSAQAMVIGPLTSAGSGPLVGAALRVWNAAPASARQAWASNYSDALSSAPDGNPAAVKPGNYGPVPVLAQAELALAKAGVLEGLLTTRKTFYGSNPTTALLLLADGSYLEDTARAQHLGGDQWGMMNETGNYPGQPWLWLYTFWYQISPFSSSGNADALVWGLMAVLSLGLLLIPWIPGLRSLPRHLGVHRLIWRRPVMRPGG